MIRILSAHVYIFRSYLLITLLIGNV